MLIERTSTSLMRLVRHLHERLLHQVLRVLLDAVEHDDRVVERVAQDRQQRRDRVRRDLAADERVDAERDHDVVDERDDGRDRHLVLEAHRDVEQDRRDRQRQAPAARGS